MSASQLVEALVFVAGLALITWQFRWLLRAYRTERDRRPREERSSRALLLVVALTVFVALASIAGLEGARRLAVGGILAVAVVEVARRRWAN